MSLSTEQATTWEDVLRQAMIADAKTSKVLKKGGDWAIGKQDRADGRDPRTAKLRAAILERLTAEPRTVRQISGSDLSAQQVQINLKYFESVGIAARIHGNSSADFWYKS